MRRGLQSIIIIGAFIAFYYFGFGIFGSTAGTIISIFSTLTVVSISLAIFMENRNPSTTMSWILLLALIPVLGLVFTFYLDRMYLNVVNMIKKHKEILWPMSGLRMTLCVRIKIGRSLTPRVKNYYYYPRL